MSDAAEDEFAGLPEEEEEFDEAGRRGGERRWFRATAKMAAWTGSEEERRMVKLRYEADGFVVDEEEAEGDGEGEDSVRGAEAEEEAAAAVCAGRGRSELFWRTVGSG